MPNTRKHFGRLAIVAAASSVLCGINTFAGTTAQPGSVTPIAGNTNGNDYATISLSGSTALRSFTTAAGFTYLPANTSIFLSSGTFTAGNNFEQLAPTSPTSTSAPDVNAIRLEWHEQGSVEGILELTRDQIFGYNSLPADAPLSLTQAGFGPTVSNPIWINQNIVAADNTSNSKGWAYGTTGANGGTNGQSPIQMAISDVKPVQGFAVNGTPAFNAAPGTPGYGLGNPLATTGNDSAGLGVVGSRQALVNSNDLNVGGRTGGTSNLTSQTVAITATDFASNPGTGLTNLTKNDAQFLELAGRMANGATFQMTTRDVNSGTRSSAANNTGIDPSWAVGLNDGGDALVSTSPAAADNQDVIGSQTIVGADGVSIPNATIRYSGKTAGGLVRTTVANSRMAVGTLSLPDSLSGSFSGNATNFATNLVNTPINILNYQGVTPTATTITNGTYAIWQQEQYVTVNSNTVAGGIQGDTPNTSAPLYVNNGSGGILNISNGAINFGNTSNFKGGFVVGQTLSGDGLAAGTKVTGIIYNDGSTTNYNSPTGSVNINGSAGTINQVLISDQTDAATSGSFQVSGYDVQNFKSNVLNAVIVAGGTLTYTSVLDPGDQLIKNGFILPQFMQVAKPYDGGAVSDNTVNGFNINTNPYGYSQTLHDFYVNSTLGLAASAPGQFYKAPTLTSGYYGAAVRGGGQQGSYPAALQVLMKNGGIAITNSNYLFGNFANNGVRDYNSFQYGLAALYSLYNSGYGVDAFDGTAGTASAAGSAAILNSNVLTDAQLNNNPLNTNLNNGTGLASVLGTSSSFIGQRGDSTFALNASTGTYTYAANASYGTENAFAPGATKGDLIVMGDYNGDGRFDGKDIYAMAVGTALSDNTSTNTLASMANVDTGVLRKNSALDLVQSTTSDASYNTSTGYSVASNASAFIRQSARVILSTTVAGSTASNAPAGSLKLYTSTGTNSSGGTISATYFTYDPTGTNSFNKTDVNRDGVVDFNDAVLIDGFSGKDYSSETDVLAATEQAPVTGTTQQANLVLMKQVDGSTVINSGDLAVANSALTGTGTTNWYGYTLNKSGSGNITWQRSGGSVNVTSGAAMQISTGTVHVLSAVDPFTDNNANLPATAVDTSKSLAVSVPAGGTLEYSSTSTSGIVVDRLSGLNVAGGTVTLDSAAVHSNHTLLIANNVSLSGTGKIDLGSNDMIIQGGNVTAVTNLVKAGLAGTAGVPSIVSTAAANDPSRLTTIGVIVNGTHYTSTNPFDGVTGIAPAATDVLVKDTYYGDANLSGTVDSADYTAIDTGYLSGGTLTGWANGDFNYDNVINGSDYTLIDNAFNTQGASLAAVVSPTASIAAEIAPGGVATAVPEPTALGLLGVGVGGLLSRRRRRA